MSMPSKASMKERLAETPAEHEARAKQGFPQTEQHLPHGLGSRFNIPLVDNLTSFLGSKNPLAKPLDPKIDKVWLLDNTAFRSKNASAWQAEFVAAYFERDSGKDLSKWVGEIAEYIGVATGQDDREDADKRIAERLRPLVETIQPARFVNFTIPSGVVQKLGPGGRNAISSQLLEFNGTFQNGEAKESSPLPVSLAPFGPMLTHFAEPTGWTVISDIDDSIKVTLTTSPIGILRSTFYDDPVPITGMPEFYAHIARTLSPNWFYLSSSPYTLYTFLRPFLHSHYPHGTLILRDASWMDLGGFLKSLTVGTAAYKEGRIEKIHSWVPGRKVLCVGDSTQSDPEAYGASYRTFGPGWIRRIFIRRVVGVDKVGLEEKNRLERFEKAFEGVPRAVWTVFDEPAELYKAVEALLAEK